MKFSVQRRYAQLNAFKKGFEALHFDGDIIDDILCRFAKCTKCNAGKTTGRDSLDSIPDVVLWNRHWTDLDNLVTPIYISNDQAHLSNNFISRITISVLIGGTERKNAAPVPSLASN